jgi:3-oxoacyl-(acyl-carrier-protein) synthase
MLEREAMVFALDPLTRLFHLARGEATALFVVSENAGTPTALQFWEKAQREGVAFANPELFPWCLANAACGALARRFGITGPNTTLMGGDEALAAAWSAARIMLQDGRAERALVVVVNFGSAGNQPGRLKAWSLLGEDGDRADG